MPFPLAALGILAGTGVAGALSNRSKTYTSEPLYSEDLGDLRSSLVNQYTSLLDSDPTFIPAYTQQGLRNIDQSGQASENLLSSILSSRGILNTTGGANALFQQGRQNLLDRANFVNSVPLIRDQRRRQLLNEGTQFLTGQAGRKSNDPGNILGGAATGLASSLAYLYGRGAFGTGTKTPGMGDV